MSGCRWRWTLRESECPVWLGGDVLLWVKSQEGGAQGAKFKAPAHRRTQFTLWGARIKQKLQSETKRWRDFVSSSWLRLVLTERKQRRQCHGCSRRRAFSHLNTGPQTPEVYVPQVLAAQAFLGHPATAGHLQKSSASIFL